MIFTGKISKSLAQELMNDSDKVLQFISEIKWQKGFVCRNCGNINFCKGKSPFSRRCTKCKKEESATANTIFHNIKFPANKAFYIAYNVCVMNKAASSIDFANLLDINQMTCWKFRKRIMKCVEENGDKDKKEIKNILLNKY